MKKTLIIVAIIIVVAAVTAVGTVRFMLHINRWRSFLGIKSLHVDEKQFGRYNIDSFS